MEKQYMEFTVNEDLNVRSKSFDAFISYMENSNEWWYIKDHNSRFIYMNECGIFYSGLPKGFNVEGRLDSECPAPWSEIQDVIQANDRNVMESQKTIPTLFTFMHSVTHGSKDKMITPWMADVTPLIKDGKSIGVVGRAKKVEIYSMYHLENNKCPESITFGNPTRLFTDREFDVIFFALQSLSAKEIARRLNLSYRSVENYLHNIYEKAGVSALNQLVEYCRNRGYDKYAPDRLINPNPYLPLA